MLALCLPLTLTLRYLVQLCQCLFSFSDKMNRLSKAKNKQKRWKVKVVTTLNERKKN